MREFVESLAMSLSAAKSRVMQAKMQIESNRLGDVEATVQAGLKFLEGLPAEETASVRAELQQILASVANQPTEEQLRFISAAKGKIRQAQRQIADQQTLGIDDTLKAAENYVVSVPDALKQEVLAEIAGLRAQAAVPVAAPERKTVIIDDRASGAKDPSQYAPHATVAAAPMPEHKPVVMEERLSGAKPASAPLAAPVSAPAPVAATPAPVAAATAALTDDQHTALSRAKNRLMQAQTLLESKRTERIPGILDEAVEFIAQLPASVAAPLTEQVTALRAGAGGADKAEDMRRVTDEMTRHLRSAKSDIPLGNFHRVAEQLSYTEMRMQTDDITAVLSAAELDDYRKQIAQVRLELAAATKADGLERARPLLDELEAKVATDPFAGLEQREAYVATGAIETLKNRIRGALRYVPNSDADVAAVEARIVAVDQKVDAASTAWGKAKQDAAVENSWAFVESAIAGWEQERSEAPTRHLQTPELPKTRLAITRVRWLLDDPATKKLRAENKGDAKIETTYANAEKIFEAAAAKLDQAYGLVIEAGEKLETPLNRFELERPGHIAHDIEQALGGTKFGAANMARARKLDARWKAEVAAIMKARQALGDKLSAEATEAWPAISATIPAVPFDPKTAKPGTVVRFDGVYNRAGWDWAGAGFSFAVGADETVVAGAFGDHINKAIEHACYELKVEFSDRVAWDVVGVVKGPAKIGERTEMVIRDKFTNFELGKVEHWPLIDCWRIDIIALHAGPIAIGKA